jgi:hypothetical protein
MPVFMNGQHLLPGKAAQIKAVLLGRQLEFAAKRGQRYITIGDGGLVLQHDIDLALGMTDGGECGLAKPVNDGGYLLGLRIQSGRKDDPRRIRIYLPPFQGGGIAAKLLRGQACG